MTATVPRRTERDDTAGGTRRHFSRRLVVALCAAVALLLVAGWIVAFSPVLGARSVVVRGVGGSGELDTSAVLRAAGIPSGTPLVRLDTAAVQRRVETLPDVATARVTTSYPSTVVITVTERVPVGVVAESGGFAVVDRTGVRYRTVASRPPGLPRFALPAGAGARATARAVATVAADLPADVRRRVRSVQAFDPAAITVIMRNGRLVRWGSAARTAEKARLLPVLLHRRAQQIDLSNPDMPVTR